MKNHSQFDTWLSYFDMMATKKYDFNKALEYFSISFIGEPPTDCSLATFIEEYRNQWIKDTVWISKLMSKYTIKQLQEWKQKKSHAKSNKLNSDVIKFLKSKGHEASRHNTKGSPIIRGGKVCGWIPVSKDERGAGDVRATINGISVWVETKIKDRQSQAQKEFQQRIEASGGLYVIVSSIEEFKEWYEKMFDVTEY